MYYLRMASVAQASDLSPKITVLAGGPYVMPVMIMFVLRNSAADRDECQTGSHDCSVHAHCHNQQGTHNCSCRRGYHGNGAFCTGEACNTYRRKCRFDIVTLPVEFMPDNNC